jgi:hypothetical protein
MDGALLLFLLRLLSAFLLLAFLGLIVWFMRQDARALTQALAQQSRVYGHLRVVAAPPDGPGPGSQYPLAPVTSIGRAARNTLTLDDGYLSNEHALITWRNGQWWLEDRDSRNGTFLNNMPVHDAVVLATGDLITLGETELRVDLAVEPEEEGEAE